LIEVLLGNQFRAKMQKRGRDKMSKDDLAANIETMSLSELAALEAEAIQTAAATIAPLEPNEAEKRVIALKREMSSH
jgi:hypothetical protein